MPQRSSGMSAPYEQAADLHIDDPRVQQRVDRLFAACEKNLKGFDRPLIEKAFRLARWAHRSDKRASGEPYIVHPLDVATILVEEIPLDSTSVAAALLHDVVEDTEVDLDVIRSEFGSTMRSLVDGLTKISGVFESRSVGNAENVRKLVLSMASDVRVILVKFADRLHNMRTLEALREGKQQKIARETLDLYAPLAHRFGLFRVKNELEDLALRALEPDAYYDIVNELKATRDERERLVSSFIEPFEDRLREAGIRFEIYGRPKHIYSIWGKMQRQSKTLDEIYDLLAIRVVIETDEGEDERRACWSVYSIVTDLYVPNTSRIHDYVTRPKSNGYQSLHTTVFGPSGRPFEVQNSDATDARDRRARRGGALAVQRERRRRRRSRSGFGFGLGARSARSAPSGSASGLRRRSAAQPVRQRDPHVYAARAPDHAPAARHTGRFCVSGPHRGRLPLHRSQSQRQDGAAFGDAGRAAIRSRSSPQRSRHRIRTG